MKKALKVIAFLAALALIFGVCSFANSLIGNPVSKMLATITAKKHLEEHYGDRDFVLDRVTFNFKFGDYHAYVTSPSSEDTYFQLVMEMDGTLVRDEYEDTVLSGWNTAFRIRSAYRDSVEAVFESSTFPYDAHISYGDLVFAYQEYWGGGSAPEYAIVMEDLVIDKLYNIVDLGSTSGKLTVYLYDDTVSAERLAEMLLGLKQIFDDAGVRFHIIDCVLEYPKPEDGICKDGRVEVIGFLYSNIYEEGMADRVRIADESARNHHNEQDKDKNSK